MLTENSAIEFFSSKNDNSCSRGARASDFVSYKFILFCTYISRKGKFNGSWERQTFIFDIGRKWTLYGKQLSQCSTSQGVFVMEKCTVETWFTGVICQIYDPINWSEQLLKLNKFLKAWGLFSVPFCLPESLWSLWPKIPVNISKACYEWTLQ